MARTAVRSYSRVGACQAAVAKVLLDDDVRHLAECGIEEGAHHLKRPADSRSARPREARVGRDAWAY
jgi:hypothetical protein